MADVAIIAKVDRFNVETHCAFCLDFFAGEEAHGRWEYFGCWDGVTCTSDDDPCWNDHNIQFLMCPDCRVLGGEVYSLYYDRLFVQLPSECRLFKVDVMDGFNY